MPFTFEDQHTNCNNDTLFVISDGITKHIYGVISNSLAAKHGRYATVIRAHFDP